VSEIQSKTLLTVCIITYNHAPYIRKAIEGVLSQSVNFPLSILIADDFSSDGTRTILFEYQKKHPELISLILQEKNVGPAQNWADLIRTPKSKYIAYLEGDDYWIADHKLQKQVDILEANEEYSFCFHQAIRLNEHASSYDVYPIHSLNSFNAQDFFTMTTIHMGSIVYRQAIPIQIIKNHSHGDFLMLCSLLTHGKGFFLEEVMSVYRVHQSGVSFKHASLPYVSKRVNELYIEAKKMELSKEVRSQIARIYMEHTVNMMDQYSNEISKKDMLIHAIRFFEFIGRHTNFGSYFYRLVINLLK
jgi:glycosyltransferase involved in cell wall biosynthesis